MAVSHTDTSSDAEAIQLDLMREMPALQRLQKALMLSCEVIRLAKAAIRRRHPNFRKTMFV